jgi:hypothetical protein
VIRTIDVRRHRNPSSGWFVTVETRANCEMWSPWSFDLAGSLFAQCIVHDVNECRKIKAFVDFLCGKHKHHDWGVGSR